MITPVVGHVPCELDQQRRLVQARAEGAARRARGARPGRFGRGVRRIRSRGYADPVLAPRGEDVWRAFRF